MTRFNALVVAAIAGHASAEHWCSREQYTGSTWYNGIVRAAVDDRVNVAITSASDLATVLNTNTFETLADEVDSASQCGSCLYSFFTEVRSRLNTENDCDDTNSWDLGDYENLQSLDCVEEIQEEIDNMNACAGNDIDIRTGKLNTQCTEEEIYHLDATYRVYGSIVSKAWLGVDFPEGFQEAYSQLSCRDCFDWAFEDLEDQIASIGDCDLEDLYDSNCNDNSYVEDVMDDMLVCTGAYNYINDEDVPHHCSADEFMVLNDVFRVYDAAVQCGVLPSLTEDIENDNHSYDDWLVCMKDSMSPAAFGKDETTDIEEFGCWPCVRIIGEWARSYSSGDCEGDSFDDSCLSNLFESDDLDWYFYYCAGHELTYEPTQCTKTEINTKIADVYKSIVPLIEVAMDAETGLEALQEFETLVDLEAVISEVTCDSCYHQLVLDLHNVTQNADTASLCANPYDDACKNAQDIKASMARFEACAGFKLNNEPTNRCTQDEFNILADADMSHEAFDLVLSGSTKTIVEALYKFGLLMDVVIADNPSVAFPCEHCYIVLLHDLNKLDASTKAICEDEAQLAKCFAKAGLALEKFQDCSGFEFEFKADVATTAAPTSVTTEAAETTTASPDTTTKSVATMSTVSMAALVGFAALVAL